mgnify:CR=1 FL=1
MLKRRAAGFTMVELMIVVTIVAILGAIAMPTMRSVVENSRIRAAGESIQSGLAQARAEAVRLNTQVEFVLQATDWQIRRVDTGAVLQQASGKELNNSLTFTATPDGADRITDDRTVLSAPPMAARAAFPRSPSPAPVDDDDATRHLPKFVPGPAPVVSTPPSHAPVRPRVVESVPLDAPAEPAPRTQRLTWGDQVLVRVAVLTIFVALMGLLGAWKLQRDLLTSTAEARATVIVNWLAAEAAAPPSNAMNDAVQGGQFMRRLRPLTQIAGQPSVIVAAHPVKNASEDNLVPYGSGAILNELDGNLTLWKKPDSGIVSLHWQGKLRGLEFEPAPFRFEVTGCPEILDAKGREVHLPTMRPASEESAENREQQETDGKRALLLEMISNPGASQADYATALGCSKSSINRRLQSFARERLAEQFLDKWKITERGRKCVE